MWTYIKAGTLKAFTVLVISHLMFVAAQVCSNIWLSSWTNEPVVNGTVDKNTVDYRLGIYGLTGIIQSEGSYHISHAE